MPNIANSLTVSDVQATLLFADGGALDIATTLSVSGLLDLGTVDTLGLGGSTLSMGSSGAAGGTITLSSSGRIEGGVGDSIQNLGTSPTEISGSGTIPANEGIINIGTGVQIASTGAVNMTFSISPHATLSFADAVGGGTVVFSANGGSGVLDVSDLSSFNPTGIKNLNIGVGANTETTVIDFINAGTDATATLSNQSTTGATPSVFADGTSYAIPLIGNFTSVAGEPGKFVNVNYLSDGVGGTDVFLTDTPCIVAGTRVLTSRGEVTVENLVQVLPLGDEGGGFRDQHLGQHSAGAFTGIFSQWIIDRFRLTERDDGGISRHGVSLLSGGSGRLDTRLDTPPSIKRRHPDSRISLSNGGWRMRPSPFLNPARRAAA